MFIVWRVFCVTHKTDVILRKTLFSLYKHNVLTILIASENRRFSLVPSNINNFIKKEEIGDLRGGPAMGGGPATSTFALGTGYLFFIFELDLHIFLYVVKIFIISLVL